MIEKELFKNLTFYDRDDKGYNFYGKQRNNLEIRREAATLIQHPLIVSVAIETIRTPGSGGLASRFRVRGCVYMFKFIKELLND